MTSEDMQQYLGLFLAEAHEQLVLLERSILALEEGTGPDALQDAFRAAHTLKGSSRAMGFQEMGDLTHAIEDIFSALRAGTVEPGTELVDALLQALDTLKSMTDQIAECGTLTVETAPIVEQLRALRSSPSQMAESAPRSNDLVPFPIWTASADEAARQARSDDFNLYDVMVHFAPDAVMKSVRAMMALQALDAIGAVLATSPEEEAIENEAFESAIRLVFASKLEPAAIEQALHQISEIARVQVRDANHLVSEPVLAETRAEPEMADVATASFVAEDVHEPPTMQPHHAPVSPHQTVRVDIARLDKLLNLVGELVIDQTSIDQLTSQVVCTASAEPVHERLSSVTAHLGRIADELQDEIMRARMQPIENLFNRFPRMVRDLAKKLGKEIEFVLSGSDTELDRSVVEVIADPLIHLLRNSVDHGIETPEERLRNGKPAHGTIWLRARHAESHVFIEVEDDGRGISPAVVRAKAIEKGLITAQEAESISDRDSLQLIFHPGLSTASQVTDLSGRGVGMDIVRSNLTRAGGQLDIRSVEGKGTAFTIRLPLTLAIIRGLMVRVGESLYALPLGTVCEALHVPGRDLHCVNGRTLFVHRDEVVPILPLDRLLEGLVLPQAPAEDRSVLVVVVTVGGYRFGLAVDHLVGEQEIVVKPLGQLLGDIQGLLGATILGDGRIALIVDVNNLLKLAIMDRELENAA